MDLLGTDQRLTARLHRTLKHTQNLHRNSQKSTDRNAREDTTRHESAGYASRMYSQPFMPTQNLLCLLQCSPRRALPTRVKMVVVYCHRANAKARKNMSMKSASARGDERILRRNGTTGSALPADTDTNCSVSHGHLGFPVLPHNSLSPYSSSYPRYSYWVLSLIRSLTCISTRIPLLLLLVGHEIRSSGKTNPPRGSNTC